MGERGKKCPKKTHRWLVGWGRKFCWGQGGTPQAFFGEAVPSTSFREPRRAPKGMQGQQRYMVRAPAHLAHGKAHRQQQQHGELWPRSAAALGDGGLFPCLSGNQKPYSHKDAIRPQSFPSLESQVTAP